MSGAAALTAFCVVSDSMWLGKIVTDVLSGFRSYSQILILHSVWFFFSKSSCL